MTNHEYKDQAEDLRRLNKIKTEKKEHTSSHITTSALPSRKLAHKKKAGLRIRLPLASLLLILFLCIVAAAAAFPFLIN
ncbi:hypothetical protein [Alteribacillus sp. HJP-4]|uniref:hypothetical protein n=1 Tax=Alteribacillus sp. HJP-4 TaxID=2775394 RepID=UPI0035CD0884